MKFFHQPKKYTEIQLLKVFLVRANLQNNSFHFSHEETVLQDLG